VLAMAKKSLALSRVYQLLEPGPVVLLSTQWRGKADVMTQSWHMVVEFEPPMVACIVSAANYTFKLLKASRECVINIPTVELSDAVVRCGNTSGELSDKFTAAGLTPVPAKEVAAQLIAECYANLECRVVDTRLMNKYNLFLLEVVQAWIDSTVEPPRTLHHRGYGSFMIAGEAVQLQSKMK
jgi:flavin reductase (DIM6/NTAB) family NADH-FMN oxidoreductase RutF